MSWVKVEKFSHSNFWSDRYTSYHKSQLFHFSKLHTSLDCFKCKNLNVFQTTDEGTFTNGCPNVCSLAFTSQMQLSRLKLPGNTIDFHVWHSSNKSRKLKKWSISWPNNGKKNISAWGQLFYIMVKILIKRD